jgi:hypothetical protein
MRLLLREAASLNVQLKIRNQSVVGLLQLVTSLAAASAAIHILQTRNEGSLAGVFGN